MKVFLTCVCALLQIAGALGGDAIIATPSGQPIPELPHDLLETGGEYVYKKIPGLTRAEKHEAEQRMFFTNVDSNQNGKLSKEELVAYMGGDAELFEMIHGDEEQDMDGDGELSWEEWFFNSDAKHKDAPEVPTPGNAPVIGGEL
jgi:hypothetical protein